MSDLTTIERLDLMDSQLRAMIEQTRVELLALRRRNYQLTATLVALVDMLSKQGVIDAGAFYAMLDAELATGPWTLEHPEPTTDDRPLNCVRCHRAISRESSVLLQAGPMCDSGTCKPEATA